MIIFLALVLIILMILIGGERGAVSLMTLAGNIVILFISILLMSIGFPALLLILAAGEESAIIPCFTRMETIQRHGRLFWLPCL